MHPPTAALFPGKPSPLGAMADEGGVNFALYSAVAEKVELCLFDASGRHEIARHVLPEYTDEIWHGYLPDAAPGLLYGYRVYGPYDPLAGHRCNPHKLLIDPYARVLHTPHAFDPRQFGHGEKDHTPDLRDDADVIPKARVVASTFDWQDDTPPRTPWSETIIYEMHARGFTKRHPEIPPHIQGTLGALATPTVIHYLQRLGITAVELLPIQAIAQEPHLAKRGMVNYWGYSPLAYGAIEPRYLAQGDPNEFKAAVRALHAAGIEVILDVVFNHTGEGDSHGPTLSFRGIDNASYYRLGAVRSHYVNDAGCGNTLRLEHPQVLELVMSTLRYWVTEYHVDGFRFDLAVTLAREQHHFTPEAAFLKAVRQDPTLRNVKLIAEPWDLGVDGYQLGRFPPGWSEWNDRYRDTVRRFWRGDFGIVADLAFRLTGSSDFFHHRGRRPWASVNFITSHDGFTLQDLVSYNQKHNAANGENNADGSDANYSWNIGTEGPSSDPAISNMRAQQKRNFLATLLFSQGVPMLTAGDEFGRTQLGNNNAYCQDNELSWLDWTKLESPDGHALFVFARKLMHLRARHPALRREQFFHGRPISDEIVKDITWLTPGGLEMTAADWRNAERQSFGCHLGYPADLTPEEDTAEHLLILFNAAAEPAVFRLPAKDFGASWRLAIDTAEPKLSGDDDIRFTAGHEISLAARSLVLLTAT